MFVKHPVFLRGSDDRGVTLAELLVAIVVLGVIIAPLTGAVIMFLRLSDQTTHQLAESNDAQVASSYFAEDVQNLGVRDWTAYPYPSKQSVELGVSGTGGLYPCGNAADVAVVRLAWDDPNNATGSPQVDRAAYVVEVNGTQSELHRILCVGSATPVADTIIAHSLDPGTPPSVACSSTCTATAAPGSVTLTLAVLDAGDANGPFTVVLTGQRRPT
jgi:prepilin-type N-terminal cleavage/methylation domain-containing protein